VPAGRRFFFVVAAAAAVVAICSERNGSGVASSGGDPAAGAQKPSMGDTSERSCEELTPLAPTTILRNSNNNKKKSQELKFPPFPQPPRPVDLIRRMGVGIGLAVYIAAERRRGEEGINNQMGNKQETRPSKGGEYSCRVISTSSIIIRTQLVLGEKELRREGWRRW